MEIIIKLGNGKMVTIEVFKTETIRDLKKKCQEKTGSNFDKLKLSYNNKICNDDNKTIDEYQIDSKSIITVINKKFQISVTTVDGMNLAIDAHNTTKIIDIKHSIQRKIGINLDEQILVYQATILNDDKTLNQYGINRESIIIILNRSKVLIFVQLSTGVTIVIHANYHDKIIDVKYLIKVKTGLEINGQMLSYQNRILEDDKTVNQYQIHDKSVISVFNNYEIRIFIKTMDGKREEFILLKTDMVIDVKKKIQQKIKLIPNEQKLIFQGTILKVEKYVSEYRIVDQSEINVVARLRSGLQIFVKTMYGKGCPIEVEKSEKIIDIKHQIQEKIGLHPDEQKLIYQGGILDDDKMIGQYGICEKSVINIVARIRRDRMQIFVKTTNGKVFSIEANKSDKIIDIKYKIQDKIGLHRDKQILIYQGGILDDDKMIGQYRFNENSTINLLEYF